MQWWQCLIYNGTLNSFVWWSDQAWIRYPSSVFFSFEVSLQMWLAHMKQWKFHQNKNTFRVSKTTFMIRFWFEGNLWKSGISIFAWSVPWKYTHSPYQSNKKNRKLGPNFLFFPLKYLWLKKTVYLWLISLCKEVKRMFAHAVHHILQEVCAVIFHGKYRVTSLQMSQIM